MNTVLNPSVVQQRHLELIRDSRRHALASVPPRERRPPQRRHSMLLNVLRPLTGH